ncbi:flagellar hook-basal body complex protein FliE [Roseobacter sp. HKCCA0434]|uniref:flagellar hook-basal body complex protein FliE n=1 Tax=Roseobacter sp. HKCCA0434 TaxID=3079297 RepID=UPI0029058F5B|nr:flagellar hook-basal body complex protein FliE [Roseobacter sp. HKCCA0434]
MDISSNSVGQAYAAGRQAIKAPAPQESPSVFARAAGSFTEAMRATENTAIGALSGQVDTHLMVQALAETELAVETAVTLRDKVVEAYQEILRMPV